MFCKSVLLVGISIIRGGAGNGRIRQGESRCTSSAAGAAGVGDDEVDDEVTALPGIIGDFEIWPSVGASNGFSIVGAAE